jgi:hypothetical protein
VAGLTTLIEGVQRVGRKVVWRLHREWVWAEPAPGDEDGQYREHHVDRDIRDFVSSAVNNGRAHHDED